VEQTQTTGTGQTAPLDIMLVGVYFCDLIFTGLPRMPVLGQEIFGSGFDILPGGTFNTAVALHRLGLKAGWLCEFGNDLFSQFVLDAARELGLDDSYFRIHDKPLCNITVSLSFAEDRAFVTYTDMFRPRSVMDLLETHQTRCVVLPVFYHQPDILTLSEQVHDQDGLLFMDCAQIDVTLKTPGVVDALRAVDIFAPNETEALQLTGAASVDEALSILAALTPLIVLKQGAGGAVARHGETTLHVSALEGLEVVDTTGAGDCFNAGFLSGYLRGESLERCLQLGNIVGGLTLRARGIQGVPTVSEVEHHLAGYLSQ
jgi:sugar/nucleoside kinase (ribokinase family)